MSLKNIHIAVILLVSTAIYSCADKANIVKDRGTVLTNQIGYSKEVPAFVQNQINWMLRLNPYDMCMLEGAGRNNPKYINQYNRNYVGGITAGVEDETDIAFLPEAHKDNLAMNWRWPEQWIPHADWFLFAVTTSS